MTKNRETGLLTFWNPAFGTYFSGEDESCPLVDISYLVSSNVSFE